MHNENDYKILSQYVYRVDEKAKDYDPNLKVGTVITHPPQLKILLTCANPYNINPKKSSELNNGKNIAAAQ